MAAIQAAEAHGVQSVLAVPILVETETPAALAFYAAPAGAFTDSDIISAEDFAAHVSTALRPALKIFQTLRRASTDATSNCGTWPLKS
ncbi:hypothetical protein ARTHRO9AX_150225 [Arthrobacter sp. 9AX]|uniref:GAF domain-containing protein n=1 Tax=Arthrobacter sp. 9AX TaxID=2653131 RepID=UPI0012F1FF12|nr:hypothetical protein ARTHRO9AX_150225 [Arthrobacter sp. 9AX]